MYYTKQVKQSTESKNKYEYVDFGNTVGVVNGRQEIQSM